MISLITKSFKRLLDKGIHRGFITYEELGKSLGKRHFSQENLEKALLYVFDNKVAFVEKRSDYRLQKKRETSSSDSEKSSDLDKSDDPIRMYLREMGGVELLSREGEIAIAKRIEAGRDVMTKALAESPLTAKKIYEWKDKFEKNELLVRTIIDIDSNYMEDDPDSVKSDSKKRKFEEDKKLDKKTDKDSTNLKEKGKEEEKTEDYVEEDEFNPSLAAMEEEIRPQVISSIEFLVKNYAKLMKYQNEKLECALNAKEKAI